MTGLEIRGLEKRFGDNPVVRGLELTLAAGEIVALLGPSGCGKTTALRMVAGLEAPDRGQIAIAGKTVWGSGADLPPERRGVGMVFQSYAVWPHRSVRDNVAYPLKLARDPDAAAKADEALALVRLSGLGDRFPSTLSGGQQQRVALARALVARPALLLFDEPLSNLDAKLREEMRHEIRTLAKRVGATALYVTHDQPEAFAVSDRVAVVLGGVVAQLGAPEALYREPATLEVARFVGRLSVLGPVERVGPQTARLGEVELPATFAPATFAPKVAARAVLGVRPEAVRLAEAGEPAIPGRVQRVTFLGERTELVVDTDFGEVRADLERALGLGEGDEVRLHVAGGRVYPAAET